MDNAIELIAKERIRQVEVEGWTTEHDDNLDLGALSDAAALYAMTDESRLFMDDDWGNDMWLHLWPFELESLKFTPDDRIKQLTKAGALIVAEIEKIQRIISRYNI